MVENENKGNEQMNQHIRKFSKNKGGLETVY